MSNKSPQKGNSDTILLFTFALIFILAVVGIPKYLKWRNESNVPLEVRHLRRISAAQTKYRASISLKNTYGNFKQLPELCGDCTDSTLTVDGLTFNLSLNYEETRFCVSAGNYALNADGKIYESETGPACEFGEVKGKLKQFAGGK